jgi:transcriptional regulator with XRE-family HTH domain
MKAIELAGKAGVSQGHLSRIETGKQAVRSEVLAKLAKALGVRPIAFYVETTAKKAPKVGKALARALLAPEFVSVVTRMAKAYVGDRAKYSSMVAVPQALVKKQARGPILHEGVWCRGARSARPRSTGESSSALTPPPREAHSPGCHDGGPVKERPPDSCPVCGGTKRPGRTSCLDDLGFGVLVVRRVPASMCSQCGADWDAFRHRGPARAAREERGRRRS